MAITISIAMQKGGVGKSTTAQALASTLSYIHHKKVLLIDMDGQANVTYASGIDNPERSITDVLGEDCSAADSILSGQYYDILPADTYLTNVERAAVEPTLLKNSISSIQQQYDFIIIDTPPALGNLSYNALAASDYVIIPCEPRPYSMQGLGMLYNTIQSVQNGSNSSLKILGILLVKYNNRTVLNRDIRDMIGQYAEQIGTSVFSTFIRESVVVSEAQMCRKPLIEYAGKKSNPNIDYQNFTTEVLTLIGE